MLAGLLSAVEGSGLSETLFHFLSASEACRCVLGVSSGFGVQAGRRRLCMELKRRALSPHSPVRLWHLVNYLKYATPMLAEEVCLILAGGLGGSTEPEVLTAATAVAMDRAGRNDHRPKVHRQCVKAVRLLLQGGPLEAGTWDVNLGPGGGSGAAPVGAPWVPLRADPRGLYEVGQGQVYRPLLAMPMSHGDLEVRRLSSGKGA